jgi:hypothetical protein
MDQVHNPSYSDSEAPLLLRAVAILSGDHREVGGGQEDHRHGRMRVSVSEYPHSVPSTFSSAILSLRVISVGTESTSDMISLLWGQIPIQLQRYVRPCHFLLLAHTRPPCSCARALPLLTYFMISFLSGSTLQINSIALWRQGLCIIWQYADYSTARYSV